jgi:hypothetical protein
VAVSNGYAELNTRIALDSQACAAMQRKIKVKGWAEYPHNPL